MTRSKSTQRRHIPYGWIFVGIILAAIIYSIINHLQTKKVPTAATETPLGSSTPNIRPSNQFSLAPTIQPTISPTPSLSPTGLGDLRGALFSDLDSTNQTIYFYDDQTSTFKAYNIVSKTTRSVSPVIDSVKNAVWAPDHQSLLIELENQPTNPNTTFFNARLPEGYTILGWYELKNHNFHRLGRAIIHYAFIANDQIIYQYNDESANNLAISRADGSHWKNIRALSGDLLLKNNGSTALAQDLTTNQIWRFTVDGKLIGSIAAPSDFNLSQSSWQDDGLQAVYWSTDNQALVLKQLSSTGGFTKLEAPSLKPDQLSILWDNKNKTVYFVNYDGVTKIKN